MLFILLAYAAFHKETKFKWLYLETFSSLIFRKILSILSALHSCLSLS